MQRKEEEDDHDNKQITKTLPLMLGNYRETEGAVVDVWQIIRGYR